MTRYTITCELHILICGTLEWPLILFILCKYLIEEFWLFCTFHSIAEFSWRALKLFFLTWNILSKDQRNQILFYLLPCMNKLLLNWSNFPLVWISYYMCFDYFLIQTKQNHIIFPFFSCQFNHGNNMCEESAGRVYVLTWYYGSCHYGHRCLAVFSVLLQT